MNRILLILSTALTIATSSMAKNTAVPHVIRNIKTSAPFTTKQMRPGTGVADLATSKTKSAESIQVTVSLDNIDQDAIGSLSVYNGEIFIEAVYGIHFLDNFFTFEISPGTYDICARGTVTGHDMAVIKENVSISQDCNIVLDANDATEKITFTATTPYGEDLRLTDQRADDPTIDWFGSTMILYREGVGPIALGLSSEDNITLSKVGGNYKIIFTEYFRNKDWGAITSGMATGTDVKNIRLENDFVKVHPESLDWKDAGSAGNNSYNFEYGILNGNEDIPFIGFGTVFDQRPDIYLGPGVFTMDDGTSLRIYGTYGINSGNNIDYALPFYNGNGMVTFLNAGHVKCGNGMFNNIEGNRSILFPGHPAYTYTSEEITQENGATAPIASVMTMVLDRGKGPGVTYMMPAYIGRRGEVRNSDLQSITTSVQIGGETVYSDSESPYNLLEWLSQRYMSDTDKTKVDVTFTNTNFTIDGLQGSNITTISYDEQNGDPTAPQIQMLSFKDTQGRFTEHFTSASDGILEFSAGDFDWVNGKNNNYWYTVELPTVKVEYSPYGKNDYSDIPVTEIPELFHMPNFGHFFRGSLECIDYESKSGWYDLRFTIADENGNTTVQTVSPAFHISSDAGISSPTADFRISICRNDIIAPAGAVVFNLNGIEVRKTDLPAGVYIVVTTDGKATKVTIR